MEYNVDFSDEWEDVTTAENRLSIEREDDRIDIEYELGAFYVHLHEGEEDRNNYSWADTKEVAEKTAESYISVAEGRQPNVQEE